MSDNKPDVFGSYQEFNKEVSNSERTAAEEMAKRTEEQIRLRNEKLKENENLTKTHDENRAKQYVEKPNTYSNTSQNEGVEPKIPMSFKETISLPQMNQAFDVIPLPSAGKLYPTKKKNIKVAFLTTADENILTSPNLVESGEFLEILLNRKILEPELRYKDLHTGDRDAIMLWLRATGYGTEYPISVLDNNGEVFSTDFDLSTLKTIELGAEPDFEGLFYFKMPLSGDEIKFKFLTTGDVAEISAWVERDKENGLIVNNESTYILLKQIVEVNGNRDSRFILNYVNNIRILDSKKLKEYSDSIESGIDLNVDIKTPGGGSINTFLPINANFFWPNARV